MHIPPFPQSNPSKLSISFKVISNINPSNDRTSVSILFSEMNILEKLGFAGDWTRCYRCHLEVGRRDYSRLLKNLSINFIRPTKYKLGAICSPRDEPYLTDLYIKKPVSFLPPENLGLALF